MVLLMRCSITMRFITRLLLNEVNRYVMYASCMQYSPSSAMGSWDRSPTWILPSPSMPTVILSRLNSRYTLPKA